MTIKLGIIGISEGNGHPYSWSAIFNGYDAQVMEDCGFPVIPRYLEQQRWPEAQITDAEVVAVWTQSLIESDRIARATKIPLVCNSVEELLDNVDAVLLARDDAENHWDFARPALELGKPIYIDKPAALTVRDLERLYSAERYPGQIFTCSALRYAHELQITSDTAASLGRLKAILATTPKSWSKYAIHIIEPTLALLDNTDKLEKLTPYTSFSHHNGAASLLVTWESGIQTIFHTLGSAAAPLTLRLHGEKSWLELQFKDSFSAFRAALQDFIDGITTETTRSPYHFNQKAISLVEAGQS